MNLRLAGEGGWVGWGLATGGASSRIEAQKAVSKAGVRPRNRGNEEWTRRENRANPSGVGSMFGYYAVRQLAAALVPEASG